MSALQLLAEYTCFLALSQHLTKNACFVCFRYKSLVFFNNLDYYGNYCRRACVLVTEGALACRTAGREACVLVTGGALACRAASRVACLLVTGGAVTGRTASRLASYDRPVTTAFTNKGIRKCQLCACIVSVCLAGCIIIQNVSCQLNLITDCFFQCCGYFCC